ncbi:hypothetical protein DM01DRAFT_1310040 [Hesseltinella vesiculosa]|uniref:FAD-binding domain-containing protein n=1 Tax=Hesseltinella vesiculosa TaxID=101127 RepID=A0A1X2G8Y4_9FUNG|nr:hypothetical protein DM01DRAFT_1310040 [Hesseltinella vesiculosa]
MIVGGGPVGLLSASLLNKAGLTVRIVDVEFQPNHWGRGDWIHGRTLELLERAGLETELLATGAHVEHIQAYKNGKLVQSSPFVPDTVDSKYPYLLCVGQHITEAMLQSQLSEHDVQVERPCTVTKIDVTADPDFPLTLTVLNMKDSTTETVHSKYLFGCDGAHSAIRKMINVDYVGDTTEINGGVLDALIRTNFPGKKQVSLLQNDMAKTVSLFPRENGLTRIFVHFDVNELDLRKEQHNRNTIQLEDIQQEAKRALMPYRLEILGTMFWSTYVVGQRLACSMQAMDSRVFLLGDAAHSQSPTLGQGLNTGFGDVFNLVWKLAMVEKNRLSKEALLTYTMERRPVAHQVIEIDKTVAAAAADPTTMDTYCKVVDRHRLFTSGFGIQYPPSDDNMLLHGQTGAGMSAPNAKVIKAVSGKKARIFDGIDVFSFSVLLLVNNLTADSLPIIRQVIQACQEGGNGGGNSQHTRPALMLTIVTTSTKDQLATCLDGQPDSDSLLDLIVLDKLNQNQCHRHYQNMTVSKQACMILALIRPDGYIATLADHPSSFTSTLQTYFDRCVL